MNGIFISSLVNILRLDKLHTFKGKSVTIFYDGDYHGPAILMIPGQDGEITVDAEDLVDFAKSAVKSELISLIEQA